MLFRSGSFSHKLHAAAVQKPQPAPPSPPQPAPQPVAKAAPNGATEDEQKLISALMGGEMTVDDLIAASGVEPKKALATLTMLEIKGVVTTLPGRRVTLA